MMSCDTVSRLKEVIQIGTEKVTSFGAKIFPGKKVLTSFGPWKGRY